MSDGSFYKISILYQSRGSLVEEEKEEEESLQTEKQTSRWAGGQTDGRTVRTETYRGYASSPMGRGIIVLIIL